MPRSAHPRAALKAPDQACPVRGGEANLGLFANIQDCVGHCLRLPVGIGCQVEFELQFGAALTLIEKLNEKLNECGSGKASGAVSTVE
jgi:hypothetical protein